MEEHARSPVAHTPDTIVREFIETYEFLPELWDVKHPHYLNKYKRNAALGVLLEVLKKSNPDATKVDVRKKINTLRSNYRRELKKIYLSKTSGGGEEVYQPTSWTFFALTFLDSVDSVASNCTVLTTPKEENEMVVSSEETEDREADVTQTTASIEPTPSTYTPRVVMVSQATRKRTYMEQQIVKNNELLERVDHHISSSEGLVQAKVWAHKLRQLEPTQRIFAEKAINDILFEATIGNLTNSVEEEEVGEKVVEF